MKYLVIAALTFGIAGAAYAAPDLRNLTCRQAEELVRTKQTIVLSDGHTSDTYIADDGECPAASKVVPAFVVVKGTHGAAMCHVGSRCAQSDSVTQDAP